VAPLYEARDLTKAYPAGTALNVPYLCLEEGRCSALVGPNGAGKSTLLEILAGLAPPTSGTLTYRGRELSRVRGAAWLAGQVTLALQHPYMFRGTVRHNVEYGLRARRVPRREARRRAERHLAALDLLDLVDRDARRLSGGETQRVSLARALAPATAVVLLDEPLSHVDADHQPWVVEAVRRLCDENRTVVMAAHDLNGLLPMVDRIITLDGGACRSDATDSRKPDEVCPPHDLARTGS